MGCNHIGVEPDKECVFCTLEYKDKRNEELKSVLRQLCDEVDNCLGFEGGQHVFQPDEYAPDLAGARDTARLFMAESASDHLSAGREVETSSDGTAERLSDGNKD